MGLVNDLQIRQMHMWSCLKTAFCNTVRKHWDVVLCEYIYCIEMSSRNKGGKNQYLQYLISKIIDWEWIGGQFLLCYFGGW